MARSALLFLAVALAQPAQEPFFFIQAADTQFGMYEENRGFAQEAANFEFLIATANRLRPAFLVVDGDLVNQPGDAAQIAEYKRIAAKLNPAIPLYNVAGNHDVGNEPTPETLAVYREHFGPDWYSFRAGPLIGVVLNSCLMHSPQKAPEEAARQETWLRAELEKLRQASGRIIVFMHHPLFLADPEEPDGYFNIPREARRRYVELFRQHGVTHVFAGHYHRNAQARADGLEVVTTGPAGKPLGKDGSGLRVVVVTQDGVGHRYYEFGWVPNRIEISPSVGPAQAPAARTR